MEKTVARMARRGLSPIAAALVLVAITVIASLVTYMWVTSYKGSLLETTEPIQLSVVLKVEGVGYSDGKLRVAVRNIGSRKTTIAALYVLRQDRTAVFAKTDLEVELEPGATTNLELEAQLSSGSYVVKLVTRTGVEATAMLTGILTQPQLRASSFQIVYYDERISGPVGSTQAFNVTLVNVGEAEGTALVRILDEKGETVDRAELSLQPSEARIVLFALKLPTERGEYTWRVIVNNTATGRLEDEKTFIVKPKDLCIVKRNAVSYTTLENLPGNWSPWGGSWTITVGIGRSGTNALQGKDDDKGPGEASLYYSQYPSSAYVAVQLKAIHPPLNRLGLALLNSSSSPFTLISANLDYKGGDKGFAIERYDNNWQTVRSYRLNPSANTWYTLIIRWEAPTLTATVYDSSGVLLARLNASVSGFTPKYVALIVDSKGTSYFDNLVISREDPRYVQVTGLEQGWTAELYLRDTLISSARADASGVARIPVVTDLIVPNARIVVKDSLGNIVIERNLSEVVGGDEYTYG